MKKISQTIERTQKFERIKEVKDKHKQLLQEHRQGSEEMRQELLRKNNDLKYSRQVQIETVVQGELEKHRSARLEMVQVLKSNREIMERQNSQELNRKKEMFTNIHSGFVGNLNLRKGQSQALREELSDQYRKRNESIKQNILEKLKRMEDLENKEMQLIQKLQSTIKVQDDMKQNYIKLTGQSKISISKTNPRGMSPAGYLKHGSPSHSSLYNNNEGSIIEQRSEMDQ